MAEWSSNPPTEEAEWSAAVSSGTATSAHYITFVSVSVARLSDRRICVKAEYYAANRTSNYSISGYYIRAELDGESYNSDSFSVYVPRGYSYELIKTLYFYADAAAGEELDFYAHFGATIYGTPAVIYAPEMGLPDIRVMTENGFISIVDIRSGSLVPDAVKVLNDNNEWSEV